MSFPRSEMINQLHAASRQYSATYATHRVHTAKIPLSTVFHGLETGSLSKAENDIQIPSTAECAVHLELLETFSRLREAILRSNQLDVLFDTMPQKQYITTNRYRRGYIVPRKVLQRPIKQYDTTFQGRRKRKWVKFVEYAFVRFRAWALAVSRRHHDAILERRNTLRKRFVPPLDILMVWHALLLKPSFCRDWCRAQRIEFVGRVHFPWIHIHAMIDTSNSTFILPPANVRSFKGLTGLQPDLLASMIEDPKSTAIQGNQSKDLQHDGSLDNLILSSGFDHMWDNYDGWVDRMCHLLWIRSPALEFTLEGARGRYKQFFELFASDSGTTLVPTPDVELIWLTHQLSPSSFASFSRTLSGRIVEHNVVARETVDQQHVMATEKAFHARFGLELQRCLCWDCQNLQRLAEGNISPSDGDLEQLIEKAMQDVAYHRAVERARRERNKSPSKV